MTRLTALSTVIGVAIFAAGSASVAQQNKPLPAQGASVAQVGSTNTGQPRTSQNAPAPTRISNENGKGLQGVNPASGQFRGNDNKQLGGANQNIGGLQPKGMDGLTGQKMDGMKQMGPGQGLGIGKTGDQMGKIGGDMGMGKLGGTDNKQGGFGLGMPGDKQKPGNGFGLDKPGGNDNKPGGGFGIDKPGGDSKKPGDSFGLGKIGDNKPGGNDNKSGGGFGIGIGKLGGNDNKQGGFGVKPPEQAGSNTNTGNKPNDNKPTGGDNKPSGNDNKPSGEKPGGEKPAGEKGEKGEKVGGGEKPDKNLVGTSPTDETRGSGTPTGPARTNSNQTNPGRGGDNTGGNTGPTIGQMLGRGNVVNPGEARGAGAPTRIQRGMGSQVNPGGIPDGVPGVP